MANIETSVQDWATEAADGFLNRNLDLNQSIRKIASRESLNREKVARVVEESNRLVFLKMFEKQADKTFTFDVADTSKIVPETSPAGGDGAAAMVRVTPAPATKTASVKTASERMMDQALSGRPIQYALDYQSKAILALEIFQEKAAMAQERVLAAEVNFCKIAQNMVSQEGYSYPELAEAMCELRPKEYKKIALMLKAAAAHMGDRFKLPDMTKYAGMVDAGEHDIVTQISCSKWPVEVINGSHKLVVALDTLIDQVTEADRANKNLWSADDSVKYLRKEIRNYMSNTRNA